jgi:hypothetical protein
MLQLQSLLNFPTGKCFGLYWLRNWKFK